MYRIIVKHIMEFTEYYYIDNDSIESLEVYKKGDKLFLDEEFEIEVTLGFNDDFTISASWWHSCEEYTYVEVFFTREAAIASLKEDLNRRIETLKQKLAALE